MQFWGNVLRLVWLFLFLIHLIPVVAVSVRFFKNPSLSNIASLGVLFAILTLSALKSLDVACLRIPLNRRSLLGVLLVAMWIHGDVVLNKLPDCITLESTLAVSAIMVVSAHRFFRKLLAQLAIGVARLHQSFKYWIEGKYVTSPLVDELLGISPRAPPDSLHPTH